MARRWLAIVVCSLWVLGCSSETDSQRPTDQSQADLNLMPPSRPAKSGTELPDPAIAGMTAPLPAREEEAQSYLESCLSPEQLKDGWIRLFDEHSQLGWFFMGSANWQFKKGIITADAGEPSVLCTSFQVSDFELLVDFHAPEQTNSGIFLRTVADPRDVQRECYELNIAPPDNKFPTGSLVGRVKVEPETLGKIAPDTWHTFRVICQGDQVKVWLDDKQIVDYTDPGKLRTGYIGLQHNTGTVHFRNVLMRPLGGQPLSTGEDWQQHWNTLGEGTGIKIASQDNALHLQGGPAQLESKSQWQDAIIQAVYQTASPEIESGILFRCLAGELDQGYEMPIYHGRYVLGAQRKLQTGALTIPQKNDFANARELVGDGSQPTYVTIIADQGQFSTFVNGLLISDVADSRPPGDNPRQSCRLSGGPIALKATNAQTDVTFSQISVSKIEH